jgi:glucokinase
MRIGIDIGGSHIAVGLINNNGNIVLKKEKILTVIDKQNMGKFIEETLAVTINNMLIEKKMMIRDIERIGIACPGTICNGVVVKAENLGIADLHIVDKLQRYFDIPIKLANDAKCAGMCEKTFGSLKEYSDAVFMCLGTGIGGAVFIDGKMLKPKRYIGMEIGHLVIKKDGLLCTCGRRRMF